jgi:hypothetical protein
VDGFYQELERILNEFPKYNLKIILRLFIAEVGKEDNFKLTLENESLHEISNSTGVRIGNFATSQNLTV